MPGQNPEHQASAPRSYLILFNIAKRRNLGYLIRTANAFGVHEIVLVGRRSHGEMGAFETRGVTPIRHFFSLDDACAYLREQDCDIYGIEIDDDAHPVHTHPFRGSTAFMLGNEGTGLNNRQRERCDAFVYIPQFGVGASINVNAAAAIVLHHFATWAGFEESGREGSRFTGR